MMSSNIGAISILGECRQCHENVPYVLTPSCGHSMCRQCFSGALKSRGGTDSYYFGGQQFRCPECAWESCIGPPDVITTAFGKIRCENCTEFFPQKLRCIWFCFRRSCLSIICSGCGIANHDHHRKPNKFTQWESGKAVQTAYYSIKRKRCTAEEDELRRRVHEIYGPFGPEQRKRFPRDVAQKVMRVAVQLATPPTPEFLEVAQDTEQSRGSDQASEGVEKYLDADVKQPLIWMRAGDLGVLALLNPTSKRSFALKSVVTRLGVRVDSDVEESYLYGVTGHKLKKLGLAKMSLKVGRQAVVINLNVIENPEGSTPAQDFDLSLGLDFIRLFPDFQFNFRRNCVQIQGKVHYFCKGKEESH